MLAQKLCAPGGGTRRQYTVGLASVLTRTAYCPSGTKSDSHRTPGLLFLIRRTPLSPSLVSGSPSFTFAFLRISLNHTQIRTCWRSIVCATYSDRPRSGSSPLSCSRTSYVEGALAQNLFSCSSTTEMVSSTVLDFIQSLC